MNSETNLLLQVWGFPFCFCKIITNQLYIKYTTTFQQVLRISRNFLRLPEWLSIDFIPLQTF